MKQLRSLARRAAARVPGLARLAAKGAAPKPGFPAWQAPAVDSAMARHWTDGTVRIAIVGLGGQGQALLKAASQLSSTSIVGIVDRSVDRLKAAANTAVNGHGDQQSFASLELCLERCTPDLVCIAVNTASHVPLALQALDAGVKRVLVEKPVASTLADADSLVARAKLAAAKGQMVLVNQSRRWNEDYRAVKRIVTGGALGAPVAVHVAWGPAGLGNMGVHLVDAARYLLGDPAPVEVQGAVDAHASGEDPNGFGRVHFSNGTALTIDLSSSLRKRRGQLTVYCENGQITVDEVAGTARIAVETGARELPLGDRGRGSLRAARVLAGTINETTPACSAEDGRDALRVVLAIMASAELGGKWVRDPFGEARSIAGSFR